MEKTDTKQTQSRREFLKTTSLSSLALFPIAKSLANTLTINEDEMASMLNDDFNSDLEFHLIDNNLLNLHFYFINVERCGHYIKIKDKDKNSFMIVRLPQMHVSEKGYFKDDWRDGTKIPCEATLSGYSYLAFQLWPNRKDNLIPKDKRLKFNLENVLNWNDEKNFDLITLVEWFKLNGREEEANRKFTFVEYIDSTGTQANCKEFKVKKTIANSDITKFKYSPEKDVTEPKSFVYNKYKSIINQFLYENTKHKNFIPITFLEVPQGLCLVPIIRNNKGELAKPEDKIQKKFWNNKWVNQDRTASGYRKYEVWNNTLFYKTEKPEKEGFEKTFKIETPSFRAVGILLTKAEEKLNFCPEKKEECIAECKKQATHNFLPSLLDKTELAYLTQYAKSAANDFTKISFDIKEVNGLFFTGLGIITHLKYYNVEDRPPEIDLIEYEHVITQGRDVFIKVSRLGYNSKTGQKYKHVIEGRRKIETVINDETGAPIYTFPEGSTSFIELKQYCECIDKDINYTNFMDEPKSQVEINDPNNPTNANVTDWYKQVNDRKFVKMSAFLIPSNDIIAPALDDSKICHYRRLPYKSLTTIEKKRTPIKVLTSKIIEDDICQIQCQPWFWPILDNNKYKIQPGVDIKDKAVEIDDYFHCEYEAKDWEDKTIKAKTPFMFLRASMLETFESKNREDAYNNYFTGTISNNIIPANEINYFERRKTIINNQKIAYTISSHGTNENKIANKVNIIETEFIDTFFRIRERKADDVAIQKVPYALFPQLLRFGGYTDHVRDLTNKKVIQILEHDENYILCKFDNVLDYLNSKGETTKNYGKQIVANTHAFINKNEAQVHNTYQLISNALQESKDKLGNLAVPDIIPDTISLDEFGVTLPKDINKSIEQGRTVLKKASDGVQKIASFNPRELLRGKLSDVCGLDLTAILDELIPAIPDNNQTPLFEINKIANKITDQINNSEVFIEINEDINAVKDKIKELEDEYKLLAKTINDKEQQLAVNLKKISNRIPNSNELDNLIKNIFESKKAEAYNFLLEQIPFTDIQQRINSTTDLFKNAVDFVKNEKILLESEITELQNVVKGIDDIYIKEINLMLSNPVYNDLSKLIKDIYVQETPAVIVATPRTIVDLLDQFISDKTNHLLNTNPEDTVYIVNTKKVYINTETFDFEEEGLQSSESIQFKISSGLDPLGHIQIQNKINDFKILIAKNVDGNKFQRVVVEQLQKSVNNIIEKYTIRLNEIQKEFNNYKFSYDFEFTDAAETTAKCKTIDLGMCSQQIKAWMPKFEQAFNDAINNGLEITVQNSIIKWKNLIIKLAPYVDILRKIDPNFYYLEQQRLQKDIKDLQSRFQQSFYELYYPIFTSISEIYQNTFLPVYNDYLTAIELFKTAIKVFQNIKNDYENGIITVEDYKSALARYNVVLEDYNDAKNKFNVTKSQIFETLKKEGVDKLHQYIKGLVGNEDIRNAYNSVYGNNGLIEELKTIKASYETKLLYYKKYIGDNISSLGDSMTDKISSYIAQHPDEVEKVREAQNLYRLLTSIKQQELSYTWNTTSFRDINLGIVSFKKYSNPDTCLKVDVKATTYFVPDKFPPVIDRIETHSENRFTNFGVGFLNCITIGFNEISFITGTGRDTHFDVKIKDVTFDGALSFVQAFESWLKTMGKGLILQKNSDNISLGYSLPIPSIQTPAFSFFNLSLNLDLKVYFDKRPMRFGFSLATAEKKFGIAATIYAGFGFFGIVVDPKNGVVEIECALEAGVWAGISIGPISGEVKIAFGFYYRKNEFGVRLEGYIVAEGRLSVWILEVSARIYLGVISENSVVEGLCIVSYSVKLGFVSKSFTGTFHKKIAGSEKNNSEQQKEELSSIQSNYRYSQKMVSTGFKSKANFIEASAEQKALALKNEISKNLKMIYSSVEDVYEDETYAVSKEEWEDFINAY